MLIPWIKEGLDPNVNYAEVRNPACRGPPWERDHFIELQYVQYANSINNMFWISSDLNGYKSRINLGQYIGDVRIHTYLCSDFTTNQTPVWQVVQGFLNSLIHNANPPVSAIGMRLSNDIGLGNLWCL